MKSIIILFQHESAKTEPFRTVQKGWGLQPLEDLKA